MCLPILSAVSPDDVMISQKQEENKKIEQSGLSRLETLRYRDTALLREYKKIVPSADWQLAAQKVSGLRRRRRRGTNRFQNYLWNHGVEPSDGRELYMCYVEELKIPILRDPSPVRVVFIEDFSTDTVSRLFWGI